MTRKILLLCINVFLPESSVTAKGGLAVLIIFGLYRLQIYCQPFKFTQNNNLELNSSVATGVTFSAGLLFASDQQHDVLDFLIFIFICFCHIKFFFNWSYMMSVASEDVKSRNSLPSLALSCTRREINTLAQLKLKLFARNRKRLKKKRPKNRKAQGQMLKKVQKVAINDSNSDLDFIISNKKNRQDKQQKKDERSIQAEKNSPSVQPESCIIELERKYQEKLQPDQVPHSSDGLASLSGQNCYNNEAPKTEEEKEVPQNIVKSILKSNIQKKHKSKIEQAFKIERRKKKSSKGKFTKKKLADAPKIEIMDVIPLNNSFSQDSEGESIRAQDLYVMNYEKSVSGGQS
ncbi:unnamed protein product [Moneuplotes crassus]|uniref:Uncharacterized protein n=1 Tax=Euplotes crassus TaxID=5936 RepID=A0AAD1XX33_EUPCR|nr:unnamed protein product [Moneuplotes crassus]